MADLVEMSAQQLKDSITGAMEHEGAKSNKPQSDIEIERSQWRNMTHRAKETIKNPLSMRGDSLLALVTLPGVIEDDLLESQ